MEALSPETNSRIAQLRAKAFSGVPLTREEMKEAVLLLRQGRVAAAEAAAKGKSRAKQPARSADALLGDLGI